MPRSTCLALAAAALGFGCASASLQQPAPAPLLQRPVSGLSAAIAAPAVGPVEGEPAAEPQPQSATEPQPAPKPQGWSPPGEDEKLSRPERQWQWIVQSGDDTCRQQLAETKARFRPLEDRERPNPHGCGIPRGVALLRGPTGVKYQPAVRVDCSFALRLGEIEAVLHAEAKEHFGAEVVSIGTLGSYACRKVVGRLRGLSGGISEHSFGNALDVTHFDLSDGRRVSVLRHYPRQRAPATRDGGRFLRQSVARVWEETGMRALGPDFDRKHRDHLHFDAGSRWWRW